LNGFEYIFLFFLWVLLDLLDLNGFFLFLLQWLTFNRTLHHLSLALQSSSVYHLKERDRIEFTGFYWVYWVLLGFTGLTGLYCFFLGFTGLLMSFTVFLGFTGFTDF